MRNEVTAIIERDGEWYGDLTSEDFDYSGVCEGEIERLLPRDQTILQEEKPANVKDLTPCKISLDLRLVIWCQRVLLSNSLIAVSDCSGRSGPRTYGRA